jgi:ferrochelatase
MFPQYAMSTWETVLASVQDAMRRLGSPASLRVLDPYYNRPEYIHALAASAAKHLEWDYDHLLLSYHGLPLRHLRKTDPTGGHCLATPDCCTTRSPAHTRCYRAQTLAATEALIDRAGIPREKCSIAYQSRFGKDTWLIPFTDTEIVRLAQSGVQRLLVMCPAFTADCLETVEEIGDQGRADFLEAGGTEMRLIPCLNEHPQWIEALVGWCERDKGSPVESFLDPT